MAVLGRWTGGIIGTMVPTTSWAAPNGLFPTQARNDGSVYSFASSTSTLTLPSSGLADGYLIVASFVTSDSSNGRYNPQGRIIQASGTGTFVGSQTGGYSRDNSENRAYARCWAFIDNPSAAATFQFQWKRDADGPNTTDGTRRSVFNVIPLYYSDVGVYSSTTAGNYGGTSPNKMTGFSGTDGSNITISSSTVTITGDNKRYLILGSYFQEDVSGGTRTQRWGGLTIDGTKENAAKGYSMYRDTSNDESGEMFTWLIETVTASRTIEMFMYRGDGVSALQGGADSDGTGTETNAKHALVVIELNDSAEVFQSVDETGMQVLRTTGPVDLNISRTGDINILDTDSFTRASDIAINSEQVMDALLGANVSGASNAIASTARWTAYSEFTRNGTELTNSVAGDYLRNNQSSQDCFGWSANLLSFMALTSGQDIGLSVTELAGTEGGGDCRSPAGWTGIWGINLDTMEETAGPVVITPSPASAVAATVNPTVVQTFDEVDDLVVEWTSGAGPLIITPAAISTIGSKVDPTPVLGDLTISDIIEAITGTINPTVIKGSILFSPQAISAITSTLDPTTILGDINITPAAIDAISQTIDPSVFFGSTSVSPGAISAIGTIIDPGVVKGSLTVLPNPAGAIGITLDPSVIKGSIVVTPGAISSIGAILDPAIIKGSIIIAPGAIEVITEKSDPVVILGTVIITPTALSAIASGVDPIVQTTGALIIVPAAIDAITGKVDPSVLGGGLTYTPGPAVSITDKIDPNLFFSSTIAAPDPAEAVSGKVDPTTIKGSLVLSDFIEAITSGVDPTIILGSIHITPAAIFAVGDYNIPTVVFGSQIVIPGAIEAITDKADPSVQTGGVIIGPGAIHALTDKNNPIIIFGSVTTSPGPAAAVTSKSDPVAILGSLGLTPAAIEAITSIIDPSIIKGGILITPAPGSAITEKQDPSVFYGPTTASPAPASAIGETISPSVILGTIILSDIISVIAEAIDPFVVPPATIITPTALSAIVETIDPAIIKGAITILPAAISALATVQDPSVFMGGQIVTSVISAIASSYGPGVTQGSMTISTTPVDAVTGAIDPIVIRGSIILANQIAQVIATVINPAVILPSQTVVPAAISAVTAKVDPTVVLGALVEEYTIGFGGDYATITEFIADHASRNFVTEKIIVRGILIDNKSYDEKVTFNCAGTSTTYYWELDAAPGVRHTGRPGTGARLKATESTGSSDALIHALDILSIKNIEIDGNGQNVWYLVYKQLMRIENCIGYNVNSTQAIGSIFAPTRNCQIINCLAFDVHSTSGYAAGFAYAGFTFNVDNFNCVAENIVSDSGKAFGIIVETGGGVFTSKNCVMVNISGGNSSICFDSECSGDYNVSGDDTAPGINSYHNENSIDLFIDPDNGDYRPKPNCVLLDNGDDLSPIFETDIVGKSRPVSQGWDIGIFEGLELIIIRVPVESKQMVNITIDYSKYVEVLTESKDYINSGLTAKEYVEKQITEYIKQTIEINEREKN
jgi:hypothetical protein